MQSLETFLTLLEKGRKLHISVHDFSGALTGELRTLSHSHITHACPVCDCAKSTAAGFSACIAHKTASNDRAAREKRPFEKLCPWGVSEIALPIVKDGAVIAIVYVGNYTKDEKATAEALRRTAENTGVDEEALLKTLPSLEGCESLDEALQIAEIVKDYLLSLPESGKTTEHWLVKNLKSHLAKQYKNAVSLTALAKLYRKNEKYLGRLFLRETGVSFKQYLIALRLKNAETLLRTSDMTVLEIALDSGFESISYFNRLFSARHGVSPSKYRAKMKNQ